MGVDYHGQLVAAFPVTMDDLFINGQPTPEYLKYAEFNHFNTEYLCDLQNDCVLYNQKHVPRLLCIKELCADSPEIKKVKDYLGFGIVLSRTVSDRNIGHTDDKKIKIVDTLLSGSHLSQIFEMLIDTSIALGIKGCEPRLYLQLAYNY